MLDPGTHNLDVMRGVTWDTEFTFYKDEAHTQILDLTGYTNIEVHIKTNPEIILSVATGNLIVTPAAGLIQPNFDTGQLPGSRELGYYIKWTDNNGKTDIPLIGTLELRTP